MRTYDMCYVIRHVRDMNMIINLVIFHVWITTLRINLGPLFIKTYQKKKKKQVGSFESYRHGMRSNFSHVKNHKRLNLFQNRIYDEILVRIIKNGLMVRERRHVILNTTKIWDYSGDIPYDLECSRSRALLLLCSYVYHYISKKSLSMY